MICINTTLYGQIQQSLLWNGPTTIQKLINDHECGFFRTRDFKMLFVCLFFREFKREQNSSFFCLVHCRTGLKFKPKPNRWGAPCKTFQVGSLQSDEVKVEFQYNIQSRLRCWCLSTDRPTEVVWENLKTAVTQSSEDWIYCQGK